MTATVERVYPPSTFTMGERRWPAPPDAPRLAWPAPVIAARDIAADDPLTPRPARALYATLAAAGWSVRLTHARGTAPAGHGAPGALHDSVAVRATSVRTGLRLASCWGRVVDGEKWAATLRAVQVRPGALPRPLSAVALKRLIEWEARCPE